MHRLCAGSEWAPRSSPSVPDLGQALPDPATRRTRIHQDRITGLGKHMYDLLAMFRSSKELGSASPIEPNMSVTKRLRFLP